MFMSICLLDLFFVLVGLVFCFLGVHFIIIFFVYFADWNVITLNGRYIIMTFFI
jgi:hypothetical protein